MGKKIEKKIGKKVPFHGKDYNEVKRMKIKNTLSMVTPLGNSNLNSKQIDYAEPKKDIISDQKNLSIQDAINSQIEEEIRQHSNASTSTSISTSKSEFFSFEMLNDKSYIILPQYSQTLTNLEGITFIIEIYKNANCEEHCLRIFNSLESNTNIIQYQSFNEAYKFYLMKINEKKKLGFKSNTDKKDLNNSIQQDNKRNLKSITTLKVNPLLSLLTNINMIETQLKKFHYNIDKIHIGNISKVHINEGYNILKFIYRILTSSDKNGQKKNLTELSSYFFIIIPHNFGYLKELSYYEINTLPKIIQKINLLHHLELANSLVNFSSDHPSLITELNDKMTVVETNSILYYYVNEILIKKRLDLVDFYEVKLSNELNTETQKVLLWKGVPIEEGWEVLINESFSKTFPKDHGWIQTINYNWNNIIMFDDPVLAYLDSNPIYKDEGIIFLCEVEISAIDVQQLPNGTFERKYNNEFTPQKCTNTNDKKKEVSSPVSISKNTILYTEQCEDCQVSQYYNYQKNKYTILDFQKVKPKYILKVKQKITDSKISSNEA